MTAQELLEYIQAIPEERRKRLTVMLETSCNYEPLIVPKTYQTELILIYK
jgi:hypothetical protein